MLTDRLFDAAFELCLWEEREKKRKNWEKFHP